MPVMAILLLILWQYPLCSAALVDQQQQVLGGGRVDGQASPGDVLALLHQTLPLALPWDRVWLASLQVLKHPNHFTSSPQPF